MIKAIIFDCFGVLTTDSWLPFKQEHFGNNPESFEQATAINKRADSGLISEKQFFDEIADLAQLPVDDVWQELRNNVPNKPLFEVVRSLKLKYKVGILSNVSNDYLQKLFSDEQIALFDVIALSFESGHLKPQPEAYEYAAEKFGLDVSECLFIDDQERNCTGAREIGMPAIWYQNFEQFQADLAVALSQFEK